MSKIVGNRASKRTTKSKEKVKKGHRAPARTVESRENQLVNLATSLAEKQLLAGTASSQVITHYIKLGTTLAALEKEKLRNENLLLAAKTAALQSAKNIEDLYAKAIKAMRGYSGQPPLPEDEDDD